MREGKAKRDTYRVRGEKMLLKAQEIEQVTGCIVHLKIKPTWKNGREFSHNGEAFNVDFNSSSTSTAYLEDSAHVTPVKKKPAMSSEIIEKNICQLCRIEYMSEADVETDSPWISCAHKTCDWWVHSRCVGIFYDNTDSGERRLEMWAGSHYYCRKHIPKVAAVGWDKEQNKEVVVKKKQQPKKSLKEAIKKKMSKKSK